MSFSWPWIFLLLPLPWLARRGHRTQTGEAIAVPGRLGDALDSIDRQHSRTRFIPLCLLWLVWLCLLLALSQPSIPGAVEVQPASGRTLMLAIDLSSSMERRDFSIDDKPVDRLSVVKLLTQDFISARSGDRVGLVLFSSQTFIASPPSFDLDSVAGVLASSGTGMAGRTTAIGDAIGMSIKSLRDDRAQDKAIVLLSDGTNNAGSVEPESAARVAQQLGIPIHTIGLASDSSQSTSGQAVQFTGMAADLDEATLVSIAELSGGRFFRAGSSAELQAVYRQIDKLEGGEARPPSVLLRQPLTPVFILALLLLASLYLALTLHSRSSR